MKVTAISALHNMSKSVHMNATIRSLTPNRTATSNSIGNMTATKVELGPTAAARLLKGNDAAALMMLTPSSSSSISAQRSHVNLLSEPAAVAQEMSHNLRPSMSQSGDSDHDITMPDHPLGESAESIAARQLYDIPQSLQDLQDRFHHEPPTINEWIILQTELTEQDQYPVVPPEKSNATALEVAITSPPPEFLYVPNRLGERLPNTIPADVPYTDNPKEMATLRQIQNSEPIPDAFEMTQPDSNPLMDRLENTAAEMTPLEALMGKPDVPAAEINARNWESTDIEAIYQQQVPQHPAAEATPHDKLIEALMSQMDLSIHR